MSRRCHQVPLKAAHQIAQQAPYNTLSADQIMAAIGAVHTVDSIPTINSCTRSVPSTLSRREAVHAWRTNTPLEAQTEQEDSRKRKVPGGWEKRAPRARARNHESRPPGRAFEISDIPATIDVNVGCRVGSTHFHTLKSTSILTLGLVATVAVCCCL